MYGGANSLNSYYDKDNGPIGGLAKPPPVDETTFYFSWFIQIVGFIISIWCSRAFTWWFLIGIIMSVLYSHTSIRLKGSPIFSVIIVALMQGFGAYCAGWIAAGRQMEDMMTVKGMLGSLSTQFITVGIYPLTQVYQFKDDIKHKDNTLAVALGISLSFKFAISFILLGCMLMAILVYNYYSRLQASIFIIYSLLLVYNIYQWGQKFRVDEVKKNFKVLHTICFVNSSCFFLFSIGNLTGLLNFL